MQSLCRFSSLRISNSNDWQPLFPKIKNTVKGHRFQDIETLKLNSTQQLQAIPKSEFQKCFEDWKHRWAKCVTANGAYFEGD
ncbi:putative DD34D transposase [Trichonephila clavipes]|uniref:Putative DD34D transposase n=1 Tax=Trichonephila clavipes TaxID=2585209 RepID=A0A8X6W2M2_TRICX|nr:putative DD34D transposase [Trichonephila clavipes]